MPTFQKSCPIPAHSVQISDPFWSDKMELVRREVIPYQYLALQDQIPGAEKSYCIENFRKAGAVAKAIRSGEIVPTYPTDQWVYTEENAPKDAFHGWVFQDSDAYKWLEAVAYSLIVRPDAALEQEADEVIDLICRAQLENGYLDTLYIINDRERVFTNLRDFHELYCFGHLCEAAVAYYRATGKDHLLKAACRFADLICRTFGEDGIRGYPGHEIAEMGLAKLYDVTGCQAYLQTARFFLEERGKQPFYYDHEHGTKTDGTPYRYHQAHCPPREQIEAVGHAVRAVYLYSGMADIANRCDDEGMYKACSALMDNILDKKLYITGGIGATHHGEAFSYDYDLPNDLAYSETCASIGLIFFCRRMLQLRPDARIADCIERALYNCVLAGMAADGKHFFYVNPLEVLPEACHKDERVRHVKPVRQKWFGCACCPPNLARLISSLGEYCYTECEDTLYLHQWIGSQISSRHGQIRVMSNYLQDGSVTLKVDPKAPFTLAVRIPAWCEEYRFTLPCRIEDSYAYFCIEDSCTLQVQFNLEPKLIRCSNRVRANIGQVAVTRGPFVYCAEEADNGADLHLLRIPGDARIRMDGDSILVSGSREMPDRQLYAVWAQPTRIPTEIRLIPYYQWGNRGENEMRVYIPME